MFGKAGSRVGKFFSVFSLALATALVLSAWAWNAPQANAQMPSDTTANTVQATFSDGELTLSSESVTAGEVTFEITNEGTTAHGFAISGAVEKSLDGTVASGETKSFTATLKPGDYKAYDPQNSQLSAEFTVSQGE